jgi:hypothetical protein
MKLFSMNVGGLDRALRIVVGIGALCLTQWGPATPWGYLGFVPLFTGLAGTCPLYSILGIKTCPLKNAQTH